MRIGDAHLTYCTNVHPGASLAEVHAMLDEHVRAVKAAICPDAPFGVGLWLGASAAAELATGDALGELAARLRELGLYVFTLNGFPFGAFHGQPIKDAVYRPDWRDPARLEHTDRLATLLAALLPEGVPGSVSTLPCAYARDVHDPAQEQLMAEHQLRHAAHLHALERATGRRITLAIEPEPCCYLETTPQTVAYFERALFSEAACRRLAQLCGTTAAEAETIARRHLGVCLDACHAAVQYETAAETVGALRAAGIEIAKVQLSAGLWVARADDRARTALSEFADPVYLHQVIVRGRNGTLTRYADLPDALAAAAAGGGRDEDAPEWRVHFHVPLHRQQLGILRSTQAFVQELLSLHAQASLSRHLEVETYTWSVLPPAERPRVVAEGIADELRFCLRALPGGASA